MPLTEFDENTTRWLQFALAAFLDVSPDSVKVGEARVGSVIVRVMLPTKNQATLLSAFKDRDSKLLEFLTPLQVLDMRSVGSTRPVIHTHDKLRIACIGFSWLSAGPVFEQARELTQQQFGHRVAIEPFDERRIEEYLGVLISAELELEITTRSQFFKLVDIRKKSFLEAAKTVAQAIHRLCTERSQMKARDERCVR